MKSAERAFWRQTRIEHIPPRKGKETFSFLVTTPRGNKFEIKDCHHVGTSIFGKWPWDIEESEIFSGGEVVSDLQSEAEQRWAQTAALNLLKKAALSAAVWAQRFGQNDPVGSPGTYAHLGSEQLRTTAFHLDRQQAVSFQEKWGDETDPAYKA
jgi:hypothetical protein